MRKTVCALVVLLSLVLSGCSAGESSTTQKGRFRAQDGGTPPSAAQLNPPTAFDTENPVALPREATTGLLSPEDLRVRSGTPPLVLVGTTAYIATPLKLIAFDVRAEKVVTAFYPSTTLLPESDPPSRSSQARGEPPLPPFVGELDGVPIVAVPFYTEQKIEADSSTEAEPLSRYQLEIVIIDTRSNKVLERITPNLAGVGSPTEHRRFYREPRISIALITDTVLVLDVESEYNHAMQGTSAIARHSGELLWKQESLHTVKATSDAVVGSVQISDGEYSTRSSVAAYSLSGEELWILGEEHGEAAIFDVDEHSVVIATRHKKRSAKMKVISVDAVSGEIASTFKESMFGDSAPDMCRAAHSALMLCVEFGEFIGVFDRRAGKTVWSFAREDDVHVSEVSAVLGDHIYMKLYSAEPTVFSIESGKEIEADPGVAPRVMNSHYGVARAARPSQNPKRLYAYPALH